MRSLARSLRPFVEQFRKAPHSRRGAMCKTVLIVDDDRDNRAIYTVILQHAGYRVVEAINGAEGLRAARENPPDLILMDLAMPVLDGWEALSRLKAEQATAQIPVCALSAHVLVEDGYQRALEAGFVCYLTKPAEPKRILSEVEERIGRASEA